MNRMIPRPFVAVLIGLGFTSIAHAAASGTAKLTGCAPAGGVMGECSMTKGTADPQTYHNIWCILDKNNIIMDEINEANPHYVPAGTGENHVFPVPVLSTGWDEGVTFCVKNFSHWWNPTVTVPLADCRTTRSG